MAKHHIDAFYDVLGLPPARFLPAVEKQFLENLKKWQLLGGASAMQRKKSIQEAVDALAVYAALGLPDAIQKQAAFAAAFQKHVKGPVPPASPDAQAIAQRMKQTEARYNVLLAKFMLLDYWEAVAKGTTKAEYPEDGSHWAVHEFLNFSPTTVRPVLELMLEDAKGVLTKPYTATLDRWRGAEVGKSVTFTKDSMSRTIKAEAYAKVGAEVKGEFELEYKGFKMKADGELFAGARATAQGQATLQKTSFSAQGSAEVEVGIRIKGNLDVDILDVLQIEAGLDALAGAMAKAEGEIEIGPTGVKLKASAEAFAGAKITGQAKGTLKIGGRPVLVTAAKASATAGIGAEAKAHFECSIFGKIGIGAGAGATLGVGTEVDTEFTIDFHNATWGAATLFWTWLNEQGWKNKGKAWFLPVEENVAMCGKARDALFQMIGDLYRQNEMDIAKLDAWKALESQVKTAVVQRNPRLAGLLA